MHVWVRPMRLAIETWLCICLLSKECVVLGIWLKGVCLKVSSAYPNDEHHALLTSMLICLAALIGFMFSLDDGLLKFQFHWGCERVSLWIFVQCGMQSVPEMSSRISSSWGNPTWICSKVPSFSLERATMAPCFQSFAALNSVVVLSEMLMPRIGDSSSAVPTNAVEDTPQIA